MTEWKLIETVPKNGTDILLLGQAIHADNSGERFVRLGRWDDFQRQFRDDNGFLIGGTRWYSHWAPIPPYPRGV